MIRKCLIAALLAAIFGTISYGQFADCSTGLLQMPTAERHAGGDGHDYVGNGTDKGNGINKGHKNSKAAALCHFFQGSFPESDLRTIALLFRE